MLKKQIILHVEDDLVDAKTLKRALTKIDDSSIDLHHSENGQEAIDYLNKLSSENLDYPNFILLDINMPIMNGLEFLKLVKSTDEYKSIPVIMLTTSKEEKDKKECFDLCAAGYFVKEYEYDAYVTNIQSILDYWSKNELPG